MKLEPTMKLEPLELFSSSSSSATSFSSPSASPEINRVSGKPKTIEISEEDDNSDDDKVDNSDDDMLYGYDSDDGFVVSG